MQFCVKLLSTKSGSRAWTSRVCWLMCRCDQIKSAVRKQRFVLQKTRSLAKKKRVPETALGPAAHFFHGF
jgi:hypothetical protein